MTRKLDRWVVFLVLFNVGLATALIFGPKIGDTILISFRGTAPGGGPAAGAPTTTPAASPGAIATAPAPPPGSPAFSPAPPPGTPALSPAPSAGAPLVGAPGTIAAPHVSLETIYWGLFRFQESPATALSPAQGKGLRKALERATAQKWRADREQAAVAAILTPQQMSTLGMWEARAATMPSAAHLSLYATRADALALLRAPLQAAAGDTGPDGPDKPRLAVPYYELLWGVLELDAHSKMPPDARQAAFIARVVAELVGVFERLQSVYASAVEVARQALRPDQQAYIRVHHEAIETYSLRLRDVVPMDADVVGYVALRMMARTARVGVHDVPAPRLLDIPVNPQPSADTKPDPEYYFAGALQLADDPKLALDARQSLALMPYVKGVADANYHSHVVKEQIGNMPRPQRLWITDRLQKTAGQPRNYPTQGAVIEALRRRAAHGG